MHPKRLLELNIEVGELASRFAAGDQSPTMWEDLERYRATLAGCEDINGHEPAWQDAYAKVLELVR
jgi:hypothetical protein